MYSFELEISCPLRGLLAQLYHHTVQTTRSRRENFSPPSQVPVPSCRPPPCSLADPCLPPSLVDDQEALDNTGGNMSDGDEPILVAVWVGDSVKPTIQQTWLVRSEAWATSHPCSFPSCLRQSIWAGVPLARGGQLLQQSQEDGSLVQCGVVQLVRRFQWASRCAG